MSDWYLYILYSSKIDKFYIGHTSDLSLRLSRHNAGWGKYTKRGIPWEIVYTETYPDKSSAVRRERELKKYKSRTLIERLVKGE